MRPSVTGAARSERGRREKVQGNTAELGGGEDHFRREEEKKDRARKQRPLWGALCLELPDSKPGMGLESQVGTTSCRIL